MPVYVCLLVFEFVYVSCPYACIDLMCVCVCVCVRVCVVYMHSHMHTVIWLLQVPT